MVFMMICCIFEFDVSVYVFYFMLYLCVVVLGVVLFLQVLREKVIVCFGVEYFFDFYGVIEFGWVMLICGDEMFVRLGSVGCVVVGQEFGIFFEEGKCLFVGEVGLVYVCN